MNPDIQKKLDEAIREYDALEMGIAESFKWPREKIARFGELSKLKVMADEYEKVDDNRKKDIEEKLKTIFGLNAGERNKAILEIRAGAGGDEAALFAMNLFKMYQAYSAKKNWAFVILDESKNDLGGYKDPAEFIPPRHRWRFCLSPKPKKWRLKKRT